MIRIAISSKSLKAKIQTHDETWFQRAKELLASLPAKPKSKDFKSLWTDIKPVFTTLQHSKCMYCETLLEGAISNDIEHFRPKAKLTNWKVPKALTVAGITVTPLPGKPSAGYRKLAYHHENYGVSCKFCNSVLKKNLFPIAGTRNLNGTDPKKMKGEKQLLIFPIGSFDTAPEKLIEFDGLLAKPLDSAHKFGRQRALVVIELFALNDAVRRKELFQARARLLDHLHSKLLALESGATAAIRQDAEEWIELLTGGATPRSSCLVSFQKLFQSRREQADRVIADAKHFLKHGSLSTE